MKYLEKYFFSYYNTTDLRFGYNRTDTSNHPIVSNETKVIISEFAKTRIGNKNKLKDIPLSMICNGK